MYFPYLRGRQFELLAIRELTEKSLLSDRVIPIVEPVKLSSTLIKTIQAFQSQNKQIGLVRNPQVGSLKRDWGNEKNAANKKKLQDLLKAGSVLTVHYINSHSRDFISKLSERNLTVSDIITICSNKNAIPYYEALFSGETPRFNFIPDETMFRRRILQNRVMFEDRFQKQNRNTDYADMDDEPFSSDHIYFDQDGYVGFSDYSIIGDDYNEIGFAPYAVAIHIVYFDSEFNLRVKHFVSDTNDDITDPAGKFAEAVEKLVVWNRNCSEKLDTLGIRAFEEAYENQTYPGLGTVKKLSLMHHFELMGRYLDKEST